MVARALLLVALAGCTVSFDHSPGRTACGPGGDCPDGLVCAPASGLCVARAALGPGELGKGCSAGNECQSGACVDGVCCDKLCGGQCESCNAGEPGICTPVSGDPAGGRAPCAGSGICAGTCDGVSPDCSFPSVECRAASCTDNVATMAATCQGGECPAAVTQECVLTADTKLCGETACAGVVDVVAVNIRTYAIMTDGSVWVWGDNYRGSFALPPDPVNTISHVPTRSPALKGVKKLFSSAWTWHECGLWEGDVLKCWGDNRSGQLGLGTKDTDAHPEPAPPLVSAGVPLTGIKDVSGSTYHTCAVKTDGSVVCWGMGNSGRLGDGLNTTHEVLYASTTVTVPAGTVAERIQGGEDHTCIMEMGSSPVWCWGTNGSGESGVDPAVTNPVTTAMVSYGPNYYNNFIAQPIGLGNGHSCAVVDTNVLCWGWNGSGKLGRGDSANSLSSDYQAKPVCRSAAADCATTDKLSGVTSLAVGEEFACAVADQTVKCWGNGGQGQLGLGEGNFLDRNYAGSGPIFSPPQPVLKVTAGKHHVCALMADRSIRCWGLNDIGAVGVPDDDDGRIPAPVMPIW